MFLVGVFSTHIGIAILWLAYLVGVACYSFGFFGSMVDERLDVAPENIIEHIQLSTQIGHNDSDFHFNEAFHQVKDVFVDHFIKPIKIDFSQRLYLGNIFEHISENLLNQFTYSFRFSRPPPTI